MYSQKYLSDDSVKEKLREIGQEVDKLIKQKYMDRSFGAEDIFAFAYQLTKIHIPMNNYDVAKNAERGRERDIQNENKKRALQRTKDYKVQNERAEEALTLKREGANALDASKNNFDNLIGKFNSMEMNASQILTTTNVRQTMKLVEALQNIQPINNADKEGYDNAYKQAIKEIVNSYQAQITKYKGNSNNGENDNKKKKKGIFGLFGPPKGTPDWLNAHQNNHHYTRLLAMYLKNENKKDNQLFNAALSEMGIDSEALKKELNGISINNKNQNRYNNIYEPKQTKNMKNSK